jgi:hypothetical protein
MSDDARFRAVYAHLAHPLQMDAVDSPEYLRMLQAWREDGEHPDIQEFLMRSAKTAPDLPLILD